MTHSSTMLLHQWFECLLTHATIPKWLVSDKHTQCSVAAMWIDGSKQGKINPCKRPGKVEYRTVELRALQQKKQDYFK